MKENSSQNRTAAEEKRLKIEQPARRKLEVRRETVKDLAPETGDAGKVKGGVPMQTKNLDR